MGRRPDRRHAELRPRDPDLGDARRARARRPGGGRRRVRPGARPALVGGARRGCAPRRQPDPRLGDRPHRGRDVLLHERARVRAVGDRRPLPRARRAELGRAGLRRLLDAHARRRGRRGRGGGRRASALGHGRRGGDRRGGRGSLLRPERPTARAGRPGPLLERPAARRCRAGVRSLGRGPRHVEAEVGEPGEIPGHELPHERKESRRRRMEAVGLHVGILVDELVAKVV